MIIFWYFLRKTVGHTGKKRSCSPWSVLTFKSQSHSWLAQVSFACTPCRGRIGWRHMHHVVLWESSQITVDWQLCIRPCFFSWSVSVHEEANLPHTRLKAKYEDDPICQTVKPPLPGSGCCERLHLTWTPPTPPHIHQCPANLGHPHHHCEGQG